MAASNPSTVVLKSFAHVRKEGVAGGAITPGHLIKRDSDGEFVVHNVAGGMAAKTFAVENELEGQDISDAYEENDVVFYHHCQPGEEVYAFVDNGQTVTRGDYLESSADGSLRKHSNASAAVSEYAHCIVAQALETVDNSAGTAHARIKVEII